MAKLFFPQLTSGVLAQYPIRKTRVVPTIKNVLLDGNIVLLSELDSNPRASRLIFQLSYQDLDVADVQALQGHFNSCTGPLRAFTFIDPTDNMLAWSSDLTAEVWQAETIQVTPGALDPQGGSNAFTLTNVGQASQEITQTLSVPANYQYCSSAYLRCAQPDAVTLLRSGSSASDRTLISIGPNWTRGVASGQLNDPGASFATGLVLMPGQQVIVYGMQLEAQPRPSRYRPTGPASGVHVSAHWGASELAIVAQAPNLFSTSFSIETNL